MQYLERPTVIVYLDVNKTITMIDSAKAEGGLDHMLTRMFAEEVVGVWDTNLPEMSYHAYTHQVSSSSDTRSALLGLFWDALEKHPRNGEIVGRRDRLKEELDAPDGELRLFKSFKSLLSVLESSGLQYRLVFSTFGPDGPKVIKELASSHPDVKIGLDGRYEADALVIGEQRYEGWEEIYSVFKNATSHMLVRHDFDHWHSNGKRAAFGKPVVMDPNDPTTVALVADDNLFEKPGEEFDIVRVITPSGTRVPLADLRDRNVFQVNVLKAAEEENYFVDMVNRALVAAGHSLQLTV